MANFFSHGNVGSLCMQQQSFPAFTAFIPSPSIKSTRLGKKNESERCKLGDLGTPPPPATSHFSTSTHLTHWKWSAADGADTCHHRRVRPERRWPPSTGAAWRGGREDKAALPWQLRCPHSGVHTNSAMLGFWALQQEDEDATGHAVSTQRHGLQVSQTN